MALLLSLLLLSLLLLSLLLLSLLLLSLSAYLKEGGRVALLFHRIQRLLSRLGEAVLARLNGSRHAHDARIHIAVALDGYAPILRHALLHWSLRREVADVAAQVKSGYRGVGAEVLYQKSRLSAC